MVSAEKKFKEIVADIFGKNIKGLKGSMRFVEDLHAKSVDTIALIAATENEFGIKVPTADARKNKTIKQTIDYINKRLKNKK